MFLLAHRRWGTLGETSVFAGLFVTRTSKYTGTSSAVRVYNFFQLLWVPLGKWIYAFLFLWFKMWRISFLALFFIPKNVRRDCESVIEFDWIWLNQCFEGNFRSSISFVSRGSISYQVHQWPLSLQYEPCNFATIQCRFLSLKEFLWKL